MHPRRGCASRYRDASSYGSRFLKTRAWGDRERNYVSSRRAGVARARVCVYMCVNARDARINWMSFRRGTVENDKYRSNKRARTRNPVVSFTPPPPPFLSRRRSRPGPSLFSFSASLRLLQFLLFSLLPAFITSSYPFFLYRFFFLPNVKRRHTLSRVKRLKNERTRQCSFRRLLLSQDLSVSNACSDAIISTLNSVRRQSV